MITSLGSVPVFVSDQERALAFYRDKLGFETTFDQRYGPDFRWVAVARRRGETELILFRPSPMIATGDQLEELNRRVGIWTGIVFLTDDIQATYEMLRERGVEFQRKPAPQGWGGIEAVFSDPDGNYFQLVQRQANK